MCEGNVIAIIVPAPLMKRLHCGSFLCTETVGQSETLLSSPVLTGGGMH